jgi:hypothetical protein
MEIFGGFFGIVSGKKNVTNIIKTLVFSKVPN